MCGKVLEAWIRERGSHLKPSTRRRAEVLIENQLTYFDSTPVLDLSTAKLWGFVEALIDDDYSPSTVHQALPGCAVPRTREGGRELTQVRDALPTRRQGRRLNASTSPPSASWA